MKLTSLFYFSTFLLISSMLILLLTWTISIKNLYFINTCSTKNVNEFISSMKLRSFVRYQELKYIFCRIGTLSLSGHNTIPFFLNNLMFYWLNCKKYSFIEKTNIIHIPFNFKDFLLVFFTSFICLFRLIHDMASLYSIVQLILHCQMISFTYEIIAVYRM